MANKSLGPGKRIPTGYGQERALSVGMAKPGIRVGRAKKGPTKGTVDASKGGGNYKAKKGFNVQSASDFR